MPPIVIAGALAAGGAVGGAAIASRGAKKAAEVQAGAGLTAAQIEAAQAERALQYQRETRDIQQANIAPWLEAGRGGLTKLSSLLGIGGDGEDFGAVLHPYGKEFVAPTAAEAAQEPGYQFRLQEGLKALQNSAAARGGLFSGATGKELQQYGQGLAGEEYQRVYGRRLGEYQQAYNIFQQNQANQYNRLAALSGTGQVAAERLGALGQEGAYNVGNILLHSGAQIGRDVQSAAAARASGYAAGGNIWGPTFSGLSSFPFQYAMLRSLRGGNPYGVTYGWGPPPGTPG